MADAGIIYNRLKVNAAIEDAKAIVFLQKEFGFFGKWLEHHHPKTKEEWIKLFINLPLYGRRNRNRISDENWIPAGRTFRKLPHTSANPETKSDVENSKLNLLQPPKEQKYLHQNGC